MTSAAVEVKGTETPGHFSTVTVTSPSGQSQWNSQGDGAGKTSSEGLTPGTSYPVSFSDASSTCCQVQTGEQGLCFGMDGGV